MTDIEITELQDRFLFEFSSHAGSPVICSAVSSLAKCLTARVEELEAEGIAVIYAFALSDGYLWFEFGAKDDAWCKREVASVVKTITAGLMSLMEAYPENVNVGT